MLSYTLKYTNLLFRPLSLSKLKDIPTIVFSPTNKLINRTNKHKISIEIDIDMENIKIDGMFEGNKKFVKG